MIKREMKLVISFHTTAEAMAMEEACRAEGCGGRLIPVPTSITAGCGLAWCARPDSRGEILELMQRHGLGCQGMTECLV